MTQQLIASLNAIPLADMTLEDQQVFAEAVALLSAQAREIERLREALEPFAREYDARREHLGREGDTWPAFQTAYHLMVVHFRKARAALQTGEG